MLRTFARALVLAGLCSAAHAADTFVPLNFNFNGMAHTGEQGVPDSPSGFRSISDRALLVQGAAGQFGSAAITGATGLPYGVVLDPGVLDVVMLGSRAAGTGWPYDATVDGDNIGIQPTWDPTPNHKTPQITSGLNIPFFANTEIGFLYQISNGGGSFQVVLGFSDASSVTVTLAGPDWFATPAVAAGGAGVTSQTRLGGTTKVWPSAESNDSAVTAPTARSLSVIEGVISVSEMIADGLGNHAGKTLTSITFQNGTYTDAARAYGIIAATVRGSAVFGPSGVGTVAPSPVVYDTSAKFAVTTTPGTGSPNTITSVSVDASSIGAGTILLNDSGAGGDVTAGDGVWSADFIVPAGAPAGAASCPFTITDAQARTATGSITFSVVAPPASTDLGTLPSGLTNFSTPVAAGQIMWVKFTLPAAADNNVLSYLDIDTEGSSVVGSTLVNDTYIGLYDALGNRVSFDDDDGTDGESQLTYGLVNPARPAPGNGLTYNGRDGALPAGTYYLFLSCYPVTTGTTNWTVTTTHTAVGTINVNLRSGLAPTGTGAPTVYTDLGVLGTDPVTASASIDAGGVTWFRDEVPEAINSAIPVRTFLDLDTEGSSIANTVMALFRDDGSGTLVLSDNDDGSDLWSQMSFGRGTRPAPGTGLTYNGRDGATLAAGVYYIAVAENSAAFGNNFLVAFLTGVNSGEVKLNVRRGYQSPVIAGPFHNPANGNDYYLFELGSNWNDNEAMAVTLGGHLASIADADENEFVRASVIMYDGTNRRAFIGLSDAASEGNFEWSDGSPLVFQNWNAGEPNNSSGVENWVEMFGSSGAWNDISLAGSVAGDYAVAEIPGAPAGCNLSDITEIGGSAEAPGTPDNQLTVDDIIVFINLFSDGVGCPGTSPCSRADVTGIGGPPELPDGQLTVDDIIAFFNAFSEGC